MTWSGANASSPILMNRNVDPQNSASNANRAGQGTARRVETPAMVGSYPRDGAGYSCGGGSRRGTGVALTIEVVVSP